LFLINADIQVTDYPVTPSVVVIEEETKDARQTVQPIGFGAKLETGIGAVATSIETGFASEFARLPSIGQLE